jgi:hypothetical protein
MWHLELPNYFIPLWFNFLSTLVSNTCNLYYVIKVKKLCFTAIQNTWHHFYFIHIHEGRLQSSWAHLITPSQNFVEVRWRSLFRSTSLGKRRNSYNAPPTSRKRTEGRWSLRNFLPRSSTFMDTKAQKSHGARYELNSVFGLEKVDRWNPIRTSVIQSRSLPMRYLGFSNHEKGAPKQEISKWSMTFSTFSRSGWSVVRNASLAKGGTSKWDRHCTSTKFRLGVIRWVHEIFKLPPVWICVYVCVCIHTHTYIYMYIPYA